MFSYAGKAHKNKIRPVTHEFQVPPIRSSTDHFYNWKSINRLSWVLYESEHSLKRKVEGIHQNFCHLLSILLFIYFCLFFFIVLLLLRVEGIQTNDQLLTFAFFSTCYLFLPFLLCSAPPLSCSHYGCYRWHQLQLNNVFFYYKKVCDIKFFM